MKRAFAVALLALACAVATGAELRIGPSDTVETVIAAQKGKRVTLRLRSGHELTGTVNTVTPRVVQISAVSGKEFFDAVVPLEAIEAVFVRTKD